MNRVSFARVAVLAAVAAAGLAGPARASDVQVRGLLDLAETTEGAALTLNRLNRGDSPFDAYRLRLFVEGKAGDQFDVFTQLMLNDATNPYVFGAYVSFTPDPQRDLHVVAGKIPSVLGTYAHRTYSNKNPLIGAPLLYQYHTTLRMDQIPATADVLEQNAGRGQYGISYTASGSPFRGMPIVYDNCWDFGVVLKGSERPFEYALGFTNGTPSTMAAAEDFNGGKTVLGRVGFTPFTGALVGVSGARGPYLSDAVKPLLPAGHAVGDYLQELVMGDAELEFEHLELRGEAYHNTFQSPFLGDLVTRGYYVEGKYTLPCGLYGAARWERMDFSSITNSEGESYPWDANRTRLEAGLGYRVSRGVLTKVVYQRNLTRGLEADDPDLVSELFATQLSLSF